MENQWVWNRRYDIGVDFIDKEHRKLFRILNRLFDFGQKEMKSQWICRETVKYFKDHALQHFKDEEKYMVSAGYAGIDRHSFIHKNFRETLLPALESKLEMTDYSEDVVDHFLGICAGWLIRHTLVEDQAIVSGKKIMQWENLLPEEEQTVIVQSIASRLYDMIQLRPRVISSYYCGIKSGDEIFYRLVYRNSEKEYEFLFGFGERLIISTTNGVTDMKPADADALLNDAAKKIAEQLAESILEHLSAEQYGMQEEQLLDYHQFHHILESNSLRWSLLFDTEEGYFAYGMSERDIVTDQHAGTDTEENVPAKDQKSPDYDEKEQVNRKKLLIIDNSEFMLQMMQQLFWDDYDVMTATTVLSAYRYMTLSRPDLILADYKMPDCGGKQIMEMIRSEKAYSDIPVIFLTSGMNEESVRMVTELRPQGYLYKSLPPDRIRKEVDLFLDQNGSDVLQ